MNKPTDLTNGSDSGRIAAFDVGSVRIGVSTARTDLKLATPYDTFSNDKSIWQRLEKFLSTEQIIKVIIGLPRGLDGQETEQTRLTRSFAQDFRKRFNLPIVFQDEAATSIKAEAQLKEAGKRYNKGMVDAVAATIILEDYLESRGELG